MMDVINPALKQPISMQMKLNQILLGYHTLSDMSY
jgi:hypothetical protein